MLFRSPVSIRVDTFGQYKDEDALVRAIRQTFNLTPAGIIETLSLRNPIYTETSAYGHFGTVTGDWRTWEMTDKVDLLLDVLRSEE